MWKTRTTLRQIEQDLQSDNQPVRASAIQELLRQVKADPRTRPSALKLFQKCLTTEHDPWTAATAAQGIQHIVGTIAARDAWLGLLSAPDSAMVSAAVLALDDPSFAPLLMELFNRRAEIGVRACVVHTLGRLKDSVALPLLIELLDVPALRCNAIEALSNLGDPCAIRHLEPLLNDSSESPQPDERGAVLHVRDLAGMAIRRLQRIAQSKA